MARPTNMIGMAARPRPDARAREKWQPREMRAPPHVIHVRASLLAHHRRRDAEEMRSVAPFDLPLIDERNLGFVYQRRELRFGVSRCI